jgi:hypothetical protein
MRIWKNALRRGLFVLLAGGTLFACYHPYAYCHRAYVGPRYGHAGYYRCV